MEFDDYRDADDACYEMNGRDLLGDRVTVEIARGTPHGRDREKWGSGSGGNGGGRDRRDGGNIIVTINLIFLETFWTYIFEFYVKVA